MIVDYHTHLRAPDGSIDHSAGAAARFAEAALARGVDEVGLGEHVYYFRETAAFWKVPYQTERCAYDLDPFVDAVLEAKREGLPVKLALEVDWVPGRVEELRDVLAPYPWDYLLGSIHYIDGLAIDSEPSLVGRDGVERGWARYFEELEELARSGLVDVLAHPDLVKFHGDWPDDLAPFHRGLVAAVEGTGVALEISTAGLHKPHGRLYPDEPLLRAAAGAGVPVTIASDAHTPDHVGRDFDRALELARGAGYTNVTVFEGRRSRQEPLG